MCGRWGARVGRIGPREEVAPRIDVLPLPFRDESLLLQPSPVLQLHLCLDPHRLVHLALDAGKTGPVARCSAKFLVYI